MPLIWSVRASPLAVSRGIWGWRSRSSNGLQRISRGRTSSQNDVPVRPRAGRGGISGLGGVPGPAGLPLGLLRLGPTRPQLSPARRSPAAGHHPPDPPNVARLLRGPASACRVASGDGGQVRPQTRRAADGCRWADRDLSPPKARPQADAGHPRGLGAALLHRHRAGPVVVHRHHPHRAADGWVYCCAVMDAFSRRIVG